MSERRKGKFRAGALTALLLVSVSGILSMTSCKAAPSVDEQRHTRLWEGLKKAERYIASKEDPTYGYAYESGYPMYLWGIATMYLYMGEMTGDECYQEKLARCMGYIESSAAADWTWGSKATGERSPLYNWLFADLYVNAWKLTNSPRYAEIARNIAGGLLAPGMYDAGQGHFSGDTSANGNMFSALSAGYVLGSLGTEDEALQSAALKAYSFARGLYDEGTGRWFYNQSQQGEGFYDGHAAYYQSLEICFFLEYEREFGTVFPSQRDQLDAMAIASDPVLKSYLLPADSFYYSAVAPDNTEAAASNMLLFTLLDRRFGTDHADIISRAEETVIERQYPDGKYYNVTLDGDTVTTGILVEWTSYEIVGYIAEYLFLHSAELGLERGSLGAESAVR